MDIKSVIKKLNSIDAKDLKNIDFSKLKEYNVGRIKEELVNKPKLLFNSIFIAAAVISVFYSMNYYQKEHKAIQSELDTLNKKLEISEKKKKIETEYNNFIANVPETIPNNQLIGKLSEFAEKTNIFIVSFSPLKTVESTYVNQYVVNLNIKSETYKDLANFINAIENSKYTLKVNKCSARTNSRYSHNYYGEEEVPIDAVIEIESIKLKNVS